MPKCDEGYLPEKINCFLGGRCILSVAQELMSICRGSYDTSCEQRDQLFECLTFYKNHWVDSKDIWDLTVLSLICQAIEQYKLKFGAINCHLQ